jgi:hypothetical protein
VTAAPKVLAVSRFVGEAIPVSAVVTGDTTGWALELRACDPGPNWPGPVAPLTQGPSGTWTGTFVTATWPEGNYHFTLWRTAPAPTVLLEIYVSLRGC